MRTAGWPRALQGGRIHPPGQGATEEERMQTSEHPFGTIKHYDDVGYFLCRGKEKATAETALMYLSYNIRRAIRLTGGVQRLIPRCRVFFSSGIPMPI